MNVLVIDDQRDTVLTLKRLLSRLGHQVNTASTGTEGIHLARGTQHDVIFCDMRLCDIDGCGVAQAIRAELSPPFPLLVAVSGLSREADIERATVAGFDRYLVKPVDFAVIADLLNSL